MRASEERYRQVQEHAPIGLALVNPDGRWLRVNPALCALVGYSEDELLEHTFQNITHPDDLETDLAYVRQMLAGEIATYQMEKRYIRKDGTLVWVLLSVSLVRDNAGWPLYFIAQIQDIDVRKQTEDALTRERNFLATVRVSGSRGRRQSLRKGATLDWNGMRQCSACGRYVNGEMDGHGYPRFVRPWGGSDRGEQWVGVSDGPGVGAAWRARGDGLPGPGARRASRR